MIFLLYFARVEPKNQSWKINRKCRRSTKPERSSSHVMRLYVIPAVLECIQKKAIEMSYGRAYDSYQVSGTIVGTFDYSVSRMFRGNERICSANIFHSSKAISQAEQRNAVAVCQCGRIEESGNSLRNRDFRKSHLQSRSLNDRARQFRIHFHCYIKLDFFIRHNKARSFEMPKQFACKFECEPVNCFIENSHVRWKSREERNEFSHVCMVET